MNEKFISEELVQEMPQSLLNFIWYLWETYCDPTVSESLFMLKPCSKGQRVIINSIGKTVEQDFDTAINTTIAIRKDGTKYYMSRQ